MPRSSRHKSHKQSKHSARDGREHSESDEDSKKVKERNSNKEETSVRISKDASSGEKRKSASLSREGKDLSSHGNGNVSDDHVPSKRRRDRAEAGGNDRWNGGGDERNDGVVIDSKSKVLSDSKSKSSSKRHDTEMKEESKGLVTEKEETKSGKVESKRKAEKDKPEKEKPERDSGRKEVNQYKDSKEKERAERDKKLQDGKRDSETEGKRKQGSQSVDVGEEQKVKRGNENTEGPLQDELRNYELEKEVEKRSRRKGDGSSDKDKYQDEIRDNDDRRVSSRGERDKDGRYKDDRHSDGSYRDKYRDDVNKDSRYRDGKQKEDIDRDKRHRDDKFRDDHGSRDRSTNKSDSKHLRDENDAADFRNKKSRTESSNRDGSPTFDDRNIRYKDDKGKRRSDEKEDHSDFGSHSVKEQRSDLEKRPTSSVKADPVGDRERSRSRHGDRERSPYSGSHVAKDQYRYSKQSDPKYKDLVSEERVQHYVTSAREVPGGSGVSEGANFPRSVDKSIRKDDGYISGLSAERRPSSDVRSSPRQLVEKSPSSSSTDRRQQNRSGVRRSLDIEDSGPRSGSSKDLKDYSYNEGKGSQDLPMDAYSVDEPSQADVDNMSVSSPFIRSSHLPGNVKSLLPPPPPFRSGVDSSSGFGPSEDDSRGKSNNRFKRIGDSNMGRVQGNVWKGVPNWPSPVANGFIPFQHGPPPVGFHPVMQQFSAPPMFGVRPSMELNHPGVPYHIPDTDRFSGHGRPFGWRHPVDESLPPPMHGWDASNAAMGDGSRMYGRLDWDHSRSLMSSGGWETSIDIWKGQNAVMPSELPAAAKKEDNTTYTADEVSAGHLGEEGQNEQTQLNTRAESTDMTRSGDASSKDSFEAPKTFPEKPRKISMTARDDDSRLSHIYISKLDVSADLTHPELYNECMGLMDVEQNANVEEDTWSFGDEEGIMEARVKIPSNSSDASLFAAINDSIFQKAMSLYRKHREEMMATSLPFLSNGEVTHPNVENMEIVSIPVEESQSQPNQSVDEDEQQMMDSTSYKQESETLIPFSDQEKAERAILTPKSEEPLATLNDEEDAPIPTEVSEKPEPIPILKEVKVEVDLMVSDQEISSAVDEVNLSSPADKVQSATISSSDTDTVSKASDIEEDHSAISVKEEKLVENLCGPLLFSNVSSSEAVMPELDEFGSVNLSRIHHLPESTH